MNGLPILYRVYVRIKDETTHHSLTNLLLVNNVISSLVGAAVRELKLDFFRSLVLSYPNLSSHKLQQGWFKSLFIVSLAIIRHANTYSDIRVVFFWSLPENKHGSVARALAHSPAY